LIPLQIKNLNKYYEKFHLKDVSFDLEEGYIMGFIGSNGAGKTTTLKAILNMIHTDGGEIRIFGKNYKDHELELKQDIGVAFGGVNFYTKSKISTLTDVVKRFYSNWDEETYFYYLKKFKLDPDKKISALSEGMKVKYSLTLALSHQARLLILDEPTSGLDPVARDQLLETFQELVEDGTRSILFSTHITSDLDKCADYVTYINNGEIIASNTRDEFLDTYRIIKGTQQDFETVSKNLIAYKTNAFGFTGLVKKSEFTPVNGLLQEKPNLEDIMIYYARREELVNA
jgi:ABC-2 type transport system ATP-binding protein